MKRNAYDELLGLIDKQIIEKKDFDEIGEYKDFLNEKSKEDFEIILDNIGAIPENIDHDSTKEKIYSKVSDIVLSKAFEYLGLESEVELGRGDKADLFAKSKYHPYSLVADAKCFRLSRSTLNQKDCKIAQLDNWRGREHEYAILVSPYFKYPSKNSRIYSDALEKNVCVFSWEQLSALIRNNVKESENLSFQELWNFSHRENRETKVDKKTCFLKKMDEYIIEKFRIKKEDYYELLYNNKINIDRCISEIEKWQKEMDIIKSYTKDKAVEELIESKKIKRKIDYIERYQRKLESKKE